MNDSYLMTILNELESSKCTLKSRVKRKELSFLDLDPSPDIEFNGHISLATYYIGMQHLYRKFKTELIELVENNPIYSIEQTLIELQHRVVELDILLNPKDSEILLAQINIAGNFSRHFSETYELDSVKKKSFDF
jgi:hypothetical protein